MTWLAKTTSHGSERRDATPPKKSASEKVADVRRPRRTATTGRDPRVAAMGVLDLWTDSQRAMSTLGRSLDDIQAETTTPACPEWTVRQVFAHQAGVVTDILAGRLDGLATDEWTQRQVDERADRSLGEILDEWDAGASQLVEALTPVGDGVDPRLLVDIWNHHQDVLGAVGRREEPNATGRFVIAALRANLAERLAEAGLPPLALDLGDGSTNGEAPVSVRAPAFEYARAGVGRRSRAQIRAWDWAGDDPDPYVDQIPVFAPRAHDLQEPRP